MKRGTELEMRVDRVGERGCAVGFVAEKAVHVAFAVPGDRLRVRVTGRRKKRLEARVLEVLEPSPLRTEPRCRYFGDCGGCRWQNLIYPAQLDAKRQAVEDAFSGHGLLRDVTVPPTLSAERTWFYRNKMEFSFGARRWLTEAEVATGRTFERDFALGMHVPGFFDRLIDLEECHLQSEFSVRLVNAIRELARREDWTAWDSRGRQGYLRNLVIRTPEHADEVLVNLVTNGHERERMRQVAAFLASDFPEVTTLVNTINTGVAQVATGEEVHTVFGPGVVHDRIGPHQFEIGPHSFFQTNTRQAERLYQIALEFARPRADDVVLDLYAGLGTISLFFAGHVRHVVGVELDRATVEAARRNAQANGVANATFVAADLNRGLPGDLLDGRGRPDVVVLDPPRAGLHPRTVRQVALLRADRLVYVSCNPETQARDLEMLRADYKLARVQPVDLFPHTEHVETVAELCSARSLRPDDATDRHGAGPTGDDP